MNDTYICEKCGKSLLKLNKILHDLHCQSNGNNDNKNNFNFSNNNNINNDFIDINEIDSYKCPICGINLSPKDKLDHMLCHQLDGENRDKEKIIYDSNNLVFNFDSDSYDENNEGINVNNNNIKINIINNNGNNINRIHHNFEFNFDNKNNYHENENFEDDLDEEIEENSMNEDLDGDFDDYDDDVINNGIEDSIIDTLPKSRIKDINKLTEDKKKCCICLENFKINDETINLPCIHIFHSDCIKKWMKRQDICPICKNKIIPEN